MYFVVCYFLSNLLSARSLLSKGASKMLRATGHARMVMLFYACGSIHAERCILCQKPGYTG